MTTKQSLSCRRWRACTLDLVPTFRQHVQRLGSKGRIYEDPLPLTSTRHPNPQTSDQFDGPSAVSTVISRTWFARAVAPDPCELVERAPITVGGSRIRWKRPARINHWVTQFLKCHTWLHRFPSQYRSLVICPLSRRSEPPSRFAPKPTCDLLGHSYF